MNLGYEDPYSIINLQIAWISLNLKHNQHNTRYMNICDMNHICGYLNLTLLKALRSNSRILIM